MTPEFIAIYLAHLGNMADNPKMRFAFAVSHANKLTRFSMGIGRLKTIYNSVLDFMDRYKI